MKRLFAFGLGYSAQVLAERLAAKGWEIAGTVRDPVSIGRLRAKGYKIAPFSGSEEGPNVAGLLAGATHLLLSIPPGESGDPVLQCYGETLQQLPKLEWIGYLGTVGVYGDSGGAWLDEMAPAETRNRRTAARVEAEHAWLSLGARTGKSVQILRLAGIYGPGRSALDKLRAGTAQRIVKRGQVFNRIHVEDIASVLEASIARPRAGAIYNVADDEPAAPDEVIAYAAKLLGIEPPPAIPFDQAELTPMARSFYAANRRISNRLIKSELGVRLAYPTYREGLAALLCCENGSEAKIGA